MKIYLIGSLRNPKVPILAENLRDEGHDVFDDWYAAGPEADDHWQSYEQARGRTYIEGLNGLAVGHVFDFDRKHLALAEAGVLVLPAGRSGHLELGIMIGQHKRAYILLDGEPERWDMMYKFASGVFIDKKSLVEELRT